MMDVTIAVAVRGRSSDLEKDMVTPAGLKATFKDLTLSHQLLATRYRAVEGSQSLTDQSLWGAWQGQCSSILPAHGTTKPVR